MSAVPESVTVKATQIAIKALIEIMMSPQAAPQATGGPSEHKQPEEAQGPGLNQSGPPERRPEND